MKPSTWMLVVGGFVIVMGGVVALSRTPAKRVMLYGQLRQHGLPHTVSRLLAAYWPERLLSATLKMAKRYDRRTDQAKKQTAEILHRVPRPRFPARKAVRTR